MVEGSQQETLPDLDFVLFGTGQQGLPVDNNTTESFKAISISYKTDMLSDQWVLTTNQHHITHSSMYIESYGLSSNIINSLIGLI
ncbi:unnamed protein product [Schistosoma margrebowiei]|uniref:Uncharacterized protein n=1 Tax=Schistosoma margrebowiei TaxID=48269 RepID=A0A183ME90_9TREM|nr:unnamed protein product [Schistosoma margrebowiei]